MKTIILSIKFITFSIKSISFSNQIRHIVSMKRAPHLASF